MSGARITFAATLDDNAAQARLAELIGRMDDKRGFLEGVAEHLLNTTRDRFRDQADPEGVPWARLRSATIRQRERRKFTPIQILTRRSELRSSINSAVGADQVSIGTPVKHAATHQFGGTIQRSAGEQLLFRHVSWKSQKLTPGFAPRDKGAKP